MLVKVEPVFLLIAPQDSWDVSSPKGRGFILHMLKIKTVKIHSWKKMFGDN